MSCIIPNTPEINRRVSRELYFVPKRNPRSKYPASGGDVRAYFHDVGQDVFWVPFNWGLQFEPVMKYRKRRIEAEFTKELYEHQTVVFEEAMEQLNQFHTTTLEIRTGYGKTRLATKLICELGYLAAFVIPTEPLATQTKANFEKCSTLKCWIFGDEAPPRDYDVIIILVHRINKLDYRIKNRIGLLVVDECHLFLTQIRTEALLSFHPEKLIMLSATIKKKNQMDRVIRRFAGEHSIVRKPQGGNVICLETDLKFEHTENKQGGVDWSALNRSIHESYPRNKLILKLIAWLVQRHEKIMVATISKDHALYLYEILNESGYSVDYLIGAKKEFNDSQIFIGGHKKVGTGFDHEMKAKNFDGKIFECLVNCSSIKEEGPLQQLVGRLRDTSGVYYQILDNDSITKYHFSLNKSYFRAIEANVTTYKLKEYIKNSTIKEKEVTEEVTEETE